MYSRCNDCICSDSAHFEAVDNYYDAISSCIHLVVNNCIPVKSTKAGSDFTVPGWTDYVQEKHDLSRQAYRMGCYW